MKKLISVILVSIICFSVSAQEKKAVPEKKVMGQQKMRHGDKHRSHQMMKGIELTTEQKNQLKANREEYRKKIQALKQDEHITLKDFTEKKAILDKDMKSKKLALLTPQQKKQVELNKIEREKQRMERSNKKFEEMKTTLSLTDDQAKKLKTQNESAKASIKEIKENETLSNEEKKDKMIAIREAVKAERKNILTADQLKKMEEMKAERIERHQRHGNK